MENSVNISVLICGFASRDAGHVGGNSEAIETILSEVQHQVKKIYVKSQLSTSLRSEKLKTHTTCHQENQLICSSFLITDFSFF